MKVVEYVRNVSTIQRVSTVTSANRSTIDPMESTGMKRMCANVRDLHGGSIAACDLNGIKI